MFIYFFLCPFSRCFLDPFPEYWNWLLGSQRIEGLENSRPSIQMPISPALGRVDVVLLKDGRTGIVEPITARN
ncbi:hypothetical protein BDV26DRAFT_258723 [Aspergillus bertholletiae]|uniref:Uncharacterized protein n=1 Tax=Aspergillus bertholletiae TaxID=1226010 RepID=A0A5N7BD76_9EURO|nr:hypothetical protein BDV26DRAFT_258723 [Aspergillus bertholletiae]